MADYNTQTTNEVRLSRAKGIQYQKALCDWMRALISQNHTHFRCGLKFTNRIRTSIAPSTMATWWVSEWSALHNANSKLGLVPYFLIRIPMYPDFIRANQICREQRLPFHFMETDSDTTFNYQTTSPLHSIFFPDRLKPIYTWSWIGHYPKNYPRCSIRSRVLIE